MADAMNDDDLDRTVRAALSSAAPVEDPAAVRRRRQRVLAAVDAALDPALPVASNEPRFQLLPGWWRGAAAASVLVCSALLVTRMAEEPVAPPPAPVAEMAAAPAAPATAAVPPPAPVAEAPAAPRKEARRRLQEPPAAVEPAAPPLDRVATLPPVAAAPQAPVLADQARNVTPRALARAPVAETQALGLSQAAPAAARAPAPAPGLLAGASQGDIEAVRRILVQRGPDNERDADGRTALMLSVLQRHPDVVTLLLQNGADPLATDRFGQTAQGYALASGDPALLKAFGLSP